jgi:hypothetical protein
MNVELVAISASPIINAAMPSAEPPPLTSTFVSGHFCSNAVAILRAMGRIVVEPLMIRVSAKAVLPNVKKLLATKAVTARDLRAPVILLINAKGILNAPEYYNFITITGEYTGNNRQD